MASLALALGNAACGEGTTPPGAEGLSGDALVCDLDKRFLADGGVGRDGIPALTDPLFLPVEPRVDEISYFKSTDRIIGYRSPSGDWLAIPHNIMWRHEIVNLPETTITYCPLTGSALAFARLSVNQSEFGVSGLLYHANLVLYDRSGDEESLWPQMLGQARCGPRSGQSLIRVPVYEMPWEAWVELHPDTKVLALTKDMFDPALYFFNPYGDRYEDPDNGDYLGMPMGQDTRRPPKERVLGVPDGRGGGLAFPFLAMAEVGDRAVFRFEVGDEPGVVLWDAQRESAMAFQPVLNAQPVEFSVGSGGFVDDLTGTTWAVDGTPLAGPLAGTGQRLTPRNEPYVAFWRAWAAFHPDTELALGG